MSLAICINCGSIKRRPAQKCRVCGFLPLSDEDKAKSIIMSLNYEIAGEYRGKSKEELLKVASSIRDKSYKFETEEVAAVIRYAQQVKSIPVLQLTIDLMKWLALPLAMLIGVYYLLWSTR
jgi:ribosomal protein L40E